MQTQCPTCHTNYYPTSFVNTIEIRCNCLTRYVVSQQEEGIVWNKVDVQALESEQKRRQLVAWPDVRPGMIFIPATEPILDYDRADCFWTVTRGAVPAFWMDRTPVTNRQYLKFIQANPKYPVPTVNGYPQYSWNKSSRQYHPGTDDLPVVGVSWNDARQYANWAGKRLPTSAEWQVAASGTEDRTYPWGSNPPTSYLCNMENPSLTPVGQFSPQGDSLWGCVDIAGNVEEWIDARTNRDDDKVIYGGYGDSNEWQGAPRRLNIAEFCPPETRWMSIGFRCAADI